MTGAVVLFSTRPPRFWGGRFVSLVFCPKEKAMTQNELNRAVARATGESISLISSLGFVPLSDTPHEREPRTVDWDKAQQTRRVSLQPRRKRPAFIV
jgi:hypothetical protein